MGRYSEHGSKPDCPFYHQSANAARPRLRLSAVPLDRATVDVTQEPSGEIRLTVRAPWKHGAKRREHLAAKSEAAGCGALVYSRKVRECPAVRAGFGRLARVTAFGRAAKRGIKNAVGALESKFGRKVVFATVTLPGSTAEARLAVAQWSAKAIELLTHWIRYTAPGAMYCYVWEHQKSGALHLHAAIAHQDVLMLRRLERSFKDYCYRLFTKLSELSGVDLFARSDGGSWSGLPEVIRSNCVPVRKSVKRYMAKYLAKQAAVEQVHCPSRYWGCSRELRVLVNCLRRSSHRAISNWGLLGGILAVARAITDRSKCKRYEYSPPFSPTSRTLLIYPDEPDICAVYTSLVSLIHDSNEDFTELYQLRVAVVA